MKVNGLTESEKIIMKCVWDLGDAVRLSYIVKAANDGYNKNWKSQTVSTFLRKLVEKGFLEQYRNGRYFCYHVLVSKHDYRCRMLREDLEFWNDGMVDEFLDELMDENTFSNEQRTKIIEGIKKYEILL